jgi:hypothetical protein
VQLSRRHGAPYVRHLLAGVRAGHLTTEQVARELGITARRVRDLYGAYLEACAAGGEATWEPGRSGGNHLKAVPEDVAQLWRRMLTVASPAPYAFVASEALRVFRFNVDRATVRRWAITQGCAHPTRRKEPLAAVRRWQCADVGALWQLDVTPHAWFGTETGLLPLFDLVDDCSRVIAGARLYPRECLLAYLDFLSRAFREYGLPVALYVDYHSFFFTSIPDNLTYLAQALRHYDVSLKYAPTPQAKGKVERLHQFWQNRLPSYFLTHGIDQVEAANRDLDPLRLHHNTQEIHRELGRTPQQAWTEAKREHRYVLRPFREDPWWRYVWSLRSRVRVALDGTVPVGHLRQRVAARAGGWVLHCRHADGSISILANEPGTGGKPILLLRYEGSDPLWTV